MPRDAINTEKMQNQFSRITGYAFVGHTHYPGVIEEGRNFVNPAEMVGGKCYLLEYETRAIINVGSVGQPRDYDQRACYVTFDGDSVVYRRVEYDAQKACDLIHNINELDPFLGDRLLEGR